MNFSCITLTTDFGLQDNYVGILKGILISATRQTPVIDITHHITPYNITQAAITLNNAYSHFPTPSLHLVVVSPSESSHSRILAAEIDNHYFIGPDNGVFSLILAAKACSIKNVELKTSPVFPEQSMAFLAGQLASGNTHFGQLEPCHPPPCQIPIEFYDPFCRVEGDSLKPRVLFSDHFGNLITNIKNEFILKKSDAFQITVNGEFKLTLRDNLAYLQDKSAFIFPGSYGLIEICVYKSSARDTFGLSPYLEA